MNRPSLLVRLAGSPLMALLLWAGCALFIWGWYQGHVVWWQAAIAAGIAKRTLSAVGELRRYKAWEAQWDTMGTPLGGEGVPRPNASAKPNMAVLAVLVILATLLLPDSLYKPVQLVLVPMAVLALLFLLFVGCRAILRRARRDRVARMESVRAADENEPVAWVMDGARSSPSRVEAASNLPEYSARLLGGRNSIRD